MAAPEMKVYLGARNTEPSQAIEPMIGGAAMARQAYSLSAVDEYGGVIDDTYDYVEA